MINQDEILDIIFEIAEDIDVHIDVLREQIHDDGYCIDCYCKIKLCVCTDEYVDMFEIQQSKI